MNEKHISDFSETKLKSFLCEQLEKSELQAWQDHYGECVNCQKHVSDSPHNQKPEITLDEDIANTFDRWNKSFDGKQMWESIEKNLFGSQGIILVFRSPKFVQEITLKAKAAGVSSDFPPKIEVPKSMLKQDNIALTLKRDELTNNLHIGLQGGSASTRKLIKLKVFYSVSEVEEFDGKEISIGGVWVVESEKAESINKLEFSYQGDDGEV